MDRISELPRDILQQILNFLSQKEAVQTSVLSKSWRYNWCIRTNLDLSFDNFRGDKLEFLSVVDNILRRQCDERLSLDEFHLSISLDDPDLDHTSGSYLKKWVPLLTVIGLKKFRLSAYTDRAHVYRAQPLKLPPVVFGAESLQDLHLDNFVLDRETMERILPWKHLTSLRLEHVYIEDEILQKITLGCPLVENLKVEGNSWRVRAVNLNHLHNLKYLFLQLYERENDQHCSFELPPPSLETVQLCFSNFSYHKGADFRNLDSLCMQYVRSSPWDRFSSTIFPCLKRLTIYHCPGIEKTKLFINAPNILYFAYHGLKVPTISFAETSSEWKSEIYLDYNGLTWFLELHELLNSLRHSEISLAIDQHGRINKHVTVGENVDNRPIVESLKMDSRLVVYMFFICRPRNIYGYEIKSVRFLRKFLMKRESGNEHMQLLFRDLEEVSFETRVDIREEWRPLTLSDLKSGLEFRFAFKWRNTPL
ncbi:hypothetical protein ABFS82_05G013600 [Erythranthe guttata]|uniref:F-box/FBD/LRR-repeat protein At1g16930-like n=1 Tax=Erythranthe guttata TaxID=4155 RepID=UPI00064E0FE7|nr:PREDICTED: F-box/FBD/LRR-repeat protein At1g16930-like [Erythranthe guttata]|eukprot:XP_012855209.1 PREDICTED: F-box/FBD/LRR-repeat protein At1g16930-like [Erythranthe guttata]